MLRSFQSFLRKCLLIYVQTTLRILVCKIRCHGGDTQGVILNKGDMHWLRQRDCLAYEKLWKVYWWGGHRDDQLIRSLERFPRLRDLSNRIPGTKRLGLAKDSRRPISQVDSDWLRSIKSCHLGISGVTARSTRRGCVPFPTVWNVEELRKYIGTAAPRRAGNRWKGLPRQARLETSPFAFRNSINGVRLDGLEPWEEDAVLAVFWSSLARYYFFLTAGSWGCGTINSTWRTSWRCRFVCPANGRCGTASPRQWNN